MSDLNPRELPHDFLLRKYGLNISQLSNHTKQLKGDLDKTLRLILAKAKNGSPLKITPATQSKIETYDRYICDGIFEYLETNDVITENQSETLEKQADAKRDEVVDKIDTENNSDSTPPPPPTSTPTSTPTDDSNTTKIGFWDWK